MKKVVQPDKDPLQGVIVAAITPRRLGETSIDLGAMLELLDFLGQTGADAIALLGSTGEFLHFALDDRRHMTAFAAKRSRLPLLVNVSHSTLDGAVELASEAADSGVAGLLLMPPYYFRYSQETIRKFYLDFAAQARSALPIYLYNIPAFTNEIEISTALSLLDTGLFAGIKDSGGSWEYFTRLRDHATNRPYTILVGDDRLFARARAAGAHGVVSGVACAVPELMLAIEAAITSAEPDREQVEALEVRVAEFVGQILKFPAPLGIREAARQRGVKAGVGAIDLGGEEREQMKRFVSWFGPWLAAVRDECRMQIGRSSGR
jgi:dihydrodipicolinate synthase/N-acetylneuraminate lyase